MDKIPTKEEIVSYLKRNKQFFKEKFGVIHIGIFGSIVRGDQNTQSDIDIIIEMEKEKKNIHNFLNFKRFLEKQLGVKVDIGLESNIKPVVKEEIENEVIYVWEKKH